MLLLLFNFEITEAVGTWSTQKSLKKKAQASRVKV